MAKRKKTDDRLARLVEAVERGTPREVAATLIGLSAAEAEEFLARPEVLAELERAVAAVHSLAVAAILQAATVDSEWRAAAWYLERAHPEKWEKPLPGRRREETKHDDEPQEDEADTAPRLRVVLNANA